MPETREELKACPGCKKLWDNCTCSYCGCCGRWIQSGAHAYWCKDCFFHVRKGGDHHTRTYFAQTGQLCPFDEDHT